MAGFWDIRLTEEIYTTAEHLKDYTINLIKHKQKR